MTTPIESTAQAIKVLEEAAQPGHNLHEGYQSVEQYFHTKKFNLVQQEAELDKIMNGLIMDGKLPRLLLREGKELLQNADLNQDKHVDRKELKTKKDSADIGGSHLTAMENRVLATMTDRYDQLTTPGTVYGENGISEKSLIKYFKEQHDRRDKDEAVLAKLGDSTDKVTARWGTEAGFKDLAGAARGIDKFTLDWKTDREQKKLDTQNEQLRELEARSQTQTNKTLKAKQEEEVGQRKEEIAFKESLIKGMHVLSDNFDNLKDSNGLITRERLQALGELNARKHEVPEAPQDKAKEPAVDDRSIKNEQAVRDESVKAMISTLIAKGNVNETIKAINDSIDQKVPAEHRDAVAASIIKELNDKGEGAALRVAYLKQNSSQIDADHNKKFEFPELKLAFDKVNGNGNGLFAVDAAILNDTMDNYLNISDKQSIPKGRYGSGGGTKYTGISEDGLDKYDKKQSELRAAQLIENQRKAEIAPEQPKPAPVAVPEIKVEKKPEPVKPIETAAQPVKPQQPLDYGHERLETGKSPVQPIEEKKPTEPKIPVPPTEEKKPTEQQIPVKPIEEKKPTEQQIPVKPEPRKSVRIDELYPNPEHEKKMFKRFFEDKLQLHDLREGRPEWQYRTKPETEKPEPEAKTEKKESKPEPKEEKPRLQKEPDDSREQVAQLKADLAEKSRQIEAWKAEVAARKQQQETEERNRKMETAKLESGDDIQAIIKAARSTKDVENRHYIYRDEHNQEINIPVELGRRTSVLKMVRETG